MENDSREVSLFRNGANQAVRIPREFELSSARAIITREGERLIIEPLREPSDDLLTWLQGVPAEDRQIGDVPDEQGLPPLDSPEL